MMQRFNHVTVVIPLLAKATPFAGQARYELRRVMALTAPVTIWSGWAD
jgi:hypothetical protein